MLGFQKRLKDALPLFIVEGKKPGCAYVTTLSFLLANCYPQQRLRNRMSFAVTALHDLVMEQSTGRHCSLKNASEFLLVTTFWRRECWLRCPHNSRPSGMFVLSSQPVLALDSALLYPLRDGVLLSHLLLPSAGPFQSPISRCLDAF